MNVLLGGVTLALLLGCASAQELHLAVSGVLGGSGLVCAPVSCAPSPMAAARGSAVQIVTQGGLMAPHVLLMGFPPTQCSALPGIAGPLVLTNLAASEPVALDWGRIYVTGPGPHCGGWMGFARIDVPATLPAGLNVVLQMAAPSSDGIAFQWTLSNAVVVSIQ